MKTLLAAALGTALAFASSLHAAATVGQPAPAFTLTDTKGTTHSLADFAGKTVVLEWFNHECPFVKKHYGAGNMQRQQAAATGKGVVWLTINSSAPGKQGHVNAEQANAILGEWKASPTAFLLDHDGTVGQAYGAKTTPHMYVIDGEGVLRYNGAIDSNPSADPADIPGATQYVEAALGDLAANRAVARGTTQPYGCSVKY
ncbi:thioredoxin family protein [Silanimonas sp.]|jgi:peroxiredoxin|uniref:thioredoxin family protein n=1 Tax=Silanimonas sp. TaxID=1929290 RepID=UPI0022BB6702|nr:thioredoxin family protein [Silanimonas sp.]MCZ8116102.1 thioredoxin family protein [Silanimonas sp.]